MKPIDKEYSPSEWAKRMPPEEIIANFEKTIEKASADVLKHIECHLNIPYGQKPTQKLDTFGLDVLPKSAPIFVFIHGGYWQQCRYDQYRFLSKPFVESGAVTVILGYDVAPSVTMEEIIEEIKEGIAYTLQIAKDRGSSGLYIAGHSAGGHLCSMMTTVNWNGEDTESSKMLKGIIPIGGVFDLRPIAQTYINEPLMLTEESAWEMSPLRFAQNNKLYVDDIDCLIVVAEDDPPSFHRQAELFKDALDSNCCRARNVRLLTISGTDHFDIVENFTDINYLLTKTEVDGELPEPRQPQGAVNHQYPPPALEPQPEPRSPGKSVGAASPAHAAKTPTHESIMTGIAHQASITPQSSEKPTTNLDKIDRYITTPVHDSVDSCGSVNRSWKAGSIVSWASAGDINYDGFEIRRRR